ncbi:MAG: translation initiation factor IF-3 [Thermoanaerobaculia bacterium]|nr:translation initiation factor IF-3 [Thermoanaerobaculia bacterium]
MRSRWFRTFDQPQTKEFHIRPKRRFRGRLPKPEGPRTNERIRVPEVRLIDEEGEQIGVVKTDEAREIAAERGLDLVEISASARPPVCKIMDHGKFLFQQKKKQAEAKKKQKTIVVKEVQFRPRIDDHDYEFKKNHVLRFLKDEAKVKAIVRFRGREMAHKELGKDVLDRLLEDIKDMGEPESPPNMQGNRMIQIINPISEKSKKKTAKKSESKKESKSDSAEA